MGGYLGYALNGATSWNTTSVAPPIEPVPPAVALQNALLLNSIYGTKASLPPPPPPTAPTAPAASLPTASLSDALTLLQQTLCTFEQKQQEPKPKQEQPVENKEQVKSRGVGGCLRCKKELVEVYDAIVGGWRMNQQCPAEEHLFVASTLSFDHDPSLANLVCAKCALPSEKHHNTTTSGASNASDVVTSSVDEYDPTEPEMLLDVKSPPPIIDDASASSVSSPSSVSVVG